MPTATTTTPRSGLPQAGLPRVGRTPVGPPLTERPRVGQLLAGLLLVGQLLVGCGVGGPPGPARAPAPRACPASVRADAVDVPAPPSADTLGRLVPERPPGEALLCRYEPDGAGQASLRGQVALSAGLERLPQDLLLPGGTGVRACAAGADRGSHLLRLTYPDGVVWLAASCAGTSNGSFTSGYDRSDVLAASFRAATWRVPPPGDAGHRCVPERTGRAGQEFALLPAGSTSLVLCRIGGRGLVRRTATQEQRTRLQAALDAPVATREPGACPPGPVRFEVVARYPAGPPVRVVHLPGCPLDVGNGSLRAALEPAGGRALRAVLSTLGPG